MLCENCEFNGYETYNEDKDEYVYLYPEETRNGSCRDEVCNTSTCMLGDAYGGGCMILRCTKCGMSRHIPFTEGC